MARDEQYVARSSRISTNIYLFNKQQRDQPYGVCIGQELKSARACI